LSDTSKTRMWKPRMAILQLLTTSSRHLTTSSNPPTSVGGMLSTSTEQGGAIHAFPNDLSYVSASWFYRNSAPHGGAIGVINPFPGGPVGRFIVANSVFEENVANSCCGGALAVENGVSHVYNSIFSRNESLREPTTFPRGGGAISVEKVNPFVVSNTLFVENNSPDGPVLFIENQSHAEVVNNIITDNAPPEANSLLLGGFVPGITPSSGIVRNSILDQGVSDGIIMEDVTDSDPQLDMEFMPSSTSPVLGAGDNSVIAADWTDLDGDGNREEPVPWDLAGNPRVAGAEGRVDLGPFEYQPIDVSTDPPFVGPGSNTGQACMDIHPNPASTHIEISLAVPAFPGQGKVRLIDPLGRVVASVNVAADLQDDSSTRIDITHLASGTYMVDAGGGCARPVVVTGR